ncbi:MAG: PEP-CTERM sorting domain-containing protein, partial [bacterium]
GLTGVNGDESETSVKGAALGCCTAPTFLLASATEANWFFGTPKIPAISESVILYGFGPPPVYVSFQTLDGDASWDATTSACNATGAAVGACIRVPAPSEVAEPSVLLLLGSGLIAAGIAARRRIGKKG